MTSPSLIGMRTGHAAPRPAGGEICSAASSALVQRGKSSFRPPALKDEFGPPPWWTTGRLLVGKRTQSPYRGPNKHQCATGNRE